MPYKSVAAFCAAYQRLEARGRAYDWVALDRALISVCSSTPRHVNADDVFAKVAIINRTYGANLHLAGRDAERKVAQQFVKESADRILSPLAGLSQFCARTISTVLDSHEQMTKLARKVTKRVNNSFISKYLHFHFPETIPIFDSYSYANSWAIAPLPKPEWAQYRQRLNSDYGYHCGAVLQLIGELRRRRVADAPSVKLIDVLLFDSPPNG
jgi:hypothetical protein